MCDYPPEWKDGSIQIQIRELADHRCEHCGIEFEPGTNKAKTARNADGKPTIGTVHHIDGDPSNCAYDNLVYVCQRCHLHIQALWKPGGNLPAGWLPVPQWITKRLLPYGLVQKTLWEDA